jgi:hypothetical protein
MESQEKSTRIRPQLTARELAKFLMTNPDAPVFVAPSMLNLGEPEETQEFIDWEGRIQAVCVEYDGERFTIGFKED